MCWPRGIAQYKTIIKHLKLQGARSNLKIAINISGILRTPLISRTIIWYIMSSYRCFWTPQLQKLVVQLIEYQKYCLKSVEIPRLTRKIGEKNHEKPPADRRLEKIFVQKSWKTPGWPPVLWTKIRRRLSRRNISSKTPAQGRSYMPALPAMPALLSKILKFRFRIIDPEC